MSVTLQRLGLQARLHAARSLPAHTLPGAILIVLYAAFLGCYPLRAGDLCYPRGSDMAIKTPRGRRVRQKSSERRI